LEAETEEAGAPTYEAWLPDGGEEFDDSALRDLFAPLARR
jgi:hypothetical protein